MPSRGEPGLGPVRAIYRSGYWTIEVDGEGTFARYAAREDAVLVASEMARARRTACVVHKMDGTVDERAGIGRRVYGPDWRYEG